MPIGAMLPPEAVIPSLEVRDKKQALKLLASRAAELNGLSEKDIYAVLLEREQIGCTGMGGGVCIPHGRFEGLQGLHAVFAKLERPIEFGSADHKPVDLLFLLLTPAEANTEHLKALASISRVLRDKQLCEAIRATNSAGEIHRLLTSRDNDER